MTEASPSTRYIRRHRTDQSGRRNVNRTGGYQKKWNALADHPLVGESRGLGFLGALELVEDKDTRKPYDPRREIGMLCREACLRLGLVLRAVGDTIIISPPLIMSEAEIDEMIAKVVLSLIHI